jgi:hypothetical protein
MSSDAIPPVGSTEQNTILPLARADLACYAVAMCPDYRLAKHHRVLIEKLEQVERGAIKRLAILSRSAVPGNRIGGIR